MFNMKSTAAKEEKSARVLFDLENEMQDLQKAQGIQLGAQEKIQKITASLREGLTKEAFEQQQTLLAGYVALQKVLGRINRKMM